MSQQVETSDSVASARDAALRWLMGRINYERTSHIPYQERQLKLDRMRQLLTRLGQPDAGLKIAHVAGTKGKGSTSAMIAAVLTASGYRSGVFSSPHLERIEERFAVDGETCTAEEFVALVDRLKPVVRAMDEEAEREGDEASGLTYFDVTTAMALLHFVERQVDAAVLEVGLGGRLDSTNVCLPVVSVITSISFDHTKQLGNTLASIAREKAGIIKPGVPVVSGVVEPEAQSVIAEVARQHGCRLIQLGRDFDFHYQRAAAPPCGVPATTPAEARQGGTETRRQGESTSVSPSPPLPFCRSSVSGSGLDFTYNASGREHQLTGLTLAMRGGHQAANAAVALATIEELRHQGWCISTEAVRSGLATARLPGRVEIIAGEPTIVLDTAHNQASARALIEALAELPQPARRTLILSVSHDKDVRAILGELVPHFDRIVVTQYKENPRALALSALAEMVEQSHPDGHRVVTQTKTPGEAWRFVRETSIPGELVCIAGSFFLAAEIRPFVLGH